MDLLPLLPTFLLAIVVIWAAPGPAMALVLRRAAVHGVRGALPIVLGLETAVYFWALAAGVGFAALVQVSEVAFVALRVVGAAVLIVLGLRAWLAVWRSRGGADTVEPVAVGGRGWWRSFAEGAVVNLANPKAAIFAVAFYPQFVPAGHPLFATTALLAVLQVVIEVLLHVALAAGVARAGGWFRRSEIRRRLDAISGAVLVGLGVRVAASQ